MKLFRHTSGELKSVRNNPFETEGEIQCLVEKNIRAIFELKFVRSEFSVKDFRLDTLCFDPKTKSFVIIEYKKGKSWSVMDQGFAYLSLLINNKSRFVLEYNEKKEKKEDFLRREDVDWTRARIIFVSPRFTKYQRQSVDLQGVPFALWEIERYGDDIIGLFRHESSSRARVRGFETGGGDVVVGKPRSGPVSEQYHVASKSLDDGVWETYEALRDRILALEGVEMVPWRYHIDFRRNRSFMGVIVQRNRVDVMLKIKKGDLNDPRGEAEDVSKIYTEGGKADYRFAVRPEQGDLDYAMTLIRQAWDRSG